MRNITVFFSTFLICLLANAQFGSGYELNRLTQEPKDIEIGDINGDGLKDIVVNHQTVDKIGWFANLGNGQYALQKYVATTLINPFSIALGDIDQDGDQDVFASGQNSSTIVWYQNNGSGTFGSPITIASIQYGHLFADDLNNDGKIDLVVGSQSVGAIYWFENNGGGSFSAAQTITTSSSWVKEVYATDLNNDGFKEVLSASEGDDKLAWYQNLSGTGFGTQQVISTSGDGACSLHSGDLDNDGDQDIVLGSINDYEISWYKNLGAGTFSTANVLATTAYDPTSVKIADMDGDGNLDIISSYNGSYLSWIKNIGLGVFSGSTQITDVSGLYFKVADMDNDGDFDVVNTNQNLVLNENEGSGNFGADQLFSISPYPDRGQAQDVDLDGDIDAVVITGDLVYWCENIGNGIYGSIRRKFGPTPNARNAVIADLDNDGDNDCAVTFANVGTGQTNLSWMENLGNEVFGPNIPISSDATFGLSIKAADFDQDGWLDLVVGASTEVSWFKNLGNASFGSENILGTVAYCHSIDAVDLNNDSFLDVLYVSEQGNFVAWNTNLGNGTFSPQQIISSNHLFANGAHAADLDNDGDLDILVASRNDDKISYHKNQGNGVFGTETIITSGLDDAIDVWSADFDVDGDMDVLAVSVNDSIMWFENLGSGVFNTGQTIGNQGIGISVAEGGDMDNDGDMDILEINFSYNSIRWYENYNISSMQIKGEIYVDANQNGSRDSLEMPIPQLGVISTPNVGYTYSFSDGRYFMLFNGMGQYQISPQPLQYWGITTDSLVYNLSVDSTFASLDSLDFGFFPDTLVNDFETSFIGAFPRCNETVNYWIDIENTGTIFPSGVIHVQLDDSLTYVSADIVPDSIIDQNIYWSYDSLDYFETKQINLQVTMPDFNSMGDTLHSYLNLYTDSMGTIVDTVQDSLIQVVSCAYDPNDKQAMPSGAGPAGFIWPAPEKLEYYIRFQNTGTDTALTITIKDQIDPNLIWNTLHPISSSHSFTTEMTNNGLISFIFEDINLPDSNVNEQASHGYIHYSIDVAPGLPVGSQVFNTANIYFDFNPAVITNTVVHTFGDTIVPIPTQTNLENIVSYCSIDSIVAPTANDNLEGILVGTTNQSFPISTLGITTITWSYSDLAGNTVNQMQTIEILNAADIIVNNNDPYLEVMDLTLGMNIQWVDCDNGNDPITGATEALFEATYNGNFAVELTSGQNCTVLSDCYLISHVGVVELLSASIKVYPNPNNGNFVLYNNSHETLKEIRLLDIQGKVLKEISEIPQINGSTELNYLNLRPGVYYLLVVLETGTIQTKIVIN